ncbi:hypothetical protein LP414_12665 [Polaromonas sp. P1(28)-13]|nr:hypothetical protein LP414_12665 [Polaromonas sp. P1(28)-13]
MINPADILTAASSEQALEDRIAHQAGQIAAMLAPYEPRSAVYAWFDSLRAIEEFINLITVDWDDDEFERRLFSLPVVGLVNQLDEFKEIRQRMVARFGENFGIRFTNLLIQGSAIAVSFEAHGALDVAAGFHTVGTMVGYLQSRRRHFVGLLHMLPTACRGSQVVVSLDTLNVFLPLIEYSAVQMMGAQYALMVKLARERLGIAEDRRAEMAMLDVLFLEPERAKISEMPTTEEGLKMLESWEKLRPDRLFSAAELRNDILLIESAYAEFDLHGTDFAAAATLLRRLSNDFVDRDFWIVVSSSDFIDLLDTVKASPALRSALTCPSTSYMECLSTYAPFVLMDGAYRSTVTLLSRFAYSWRARSLDRRKRFQIRAGFIFEDAVAGALRRQGFLVQAITRINRHEFDVVTLRNKVIWNVQCKNNFVELTSVDSDAHRFSRYNRALVHSYKKALTKELNREHLLKEKLSLDAVQHMVVFEVSGRQRRSSNCPIQQHREIFGKSRCSTGHGLRRRNGC